MKDDLETGDSGEKSGVEPSQPSFFLIVGWAACLISLVGCSDGRPGGPVLVVPEPRETFLVELEQETLRATYRVSASIELEGGHAHLQMREVVVDRGPGRASSETTGVEARSSKLLEVAKVIEREMDGLGGVAEGWFEEPDLVSHPPLRDRSVRLRYVVGESERAAFILQGRYLTESAAVEYRARPSSTDPGVMTCAWGTVLEILRDELSKYAQGALPPFRSVGPAAEIDIFRSVYGITCSQ